MTPYDVLKSIYTKDNRQVQAEAYFPLYFSKILSQDKDNSLALSKILEYCFYIDPQNYYYLLYFFIPKKFQYNVNIKKVKGEEAEEDKLLTKLKYVLQWSDRDLKLNKKVIDEQILSNREYWESELGIQKEKVRRGKNT